MTWLLGTRLHKSRLAKRNSCCQKSCLVVGLFLQTPESWCDLFCICHPQNYSIKGVVSFNELPKHELTNSISCPAMCIVCTWFEEWICRDLQAEVPAAGCPSPPRQPPRWSPDSSGERWASCWSRRSSSSPAGRRSSSRGRRWWWWWRWCGGWAAARRSATSCCCSTPPRCCAGWLTGSLGGIR